MEYKSCIHTHTQFCDGKSSMADFCKRAAQLGYRSIGFTPHSPLPYENDWAMKKEDLIAYLEEIRYLKGYYEEELDVLCGVEWDSETPEPFIEAEYVIGSVHSFSKKGVHFSVDYAKEELERVIFELYDGSFLALCADYFEELAKHAVKKQVDLVGHFDLPTKYNADGTFINERDPAYLQHALKTADEILAARPEMLFEINTGVMARAGKRDPYPSEQILAHLAKRGASFVITGDCHKAEHLGVGYDRALELVQKHCRGRLYMLTLSGFERVEL